MSVCLVYQQHTLRSQARALSLVEVLQGRGKPVVARHLAGGTDLRGSTYDLHILIDWHAEMPLQKDPGKLVYWDIPEHLRSVLHEPVYHDLAQAVDGFIAHDIHHGRILSGFKKKVVYLPSPIPTSFLQHHYSTQRDAGIGLFGHTDLMRTRHALSIIREKLPDLPLATDQHDMAQAYQPAIHTVANPLASIPLLSRTKALLYPQMSGANTDPIWLLSAMYLGKPVIMSQDHDPGLTRLIDSVILRAGNWAKQFPEILDTPAAFMRLMHDLKPELVKTYGVHTLADRWWRTCEKLQHVQLTTKTGYSVPSGMISGTTF